MTKILTYKQTIQEVKNLKKDGKSVGLVIGFFDVLNLRHIKLIKFAKQHVDVLLVGAENDETTRLNRTNKNRPVENIEAQLEMLAELQSTDIVFKIEHIIDFKEKDAYLHYKDLFKELDPTYLVTNIITDAYAAKKKELADELGIGFIGSVDTGYID